MACSPSIKHLFAAIALLYVASSCCEAQDAIQIVARAALCFDNRTVINGCLNSMGINTNGTGNGTASSIMSFPRLRMNATAALCGTPCMGQMMLMTSCIEGILSSFQFYRPGLMQGVQSIFQMSCGGSNSNSGGNSSSGGNSTVSHLAKPRRHRRSSGNIALAKPALTTVLMPLLLAFLLFII